jgi:glycosyltransferase involved in cell wall biosynthesis
MRSIADRGSSPVSVSIVIPCYNNATTLSRAVESTVNTSDCVKEIVVVNDGSADDTGAVARSLVAKYPGRVVYVATTNGGPSRARNIGMSVSTSEYVLFLDADDFMLAGGVEKLAERAADTNADMVVGLAIDEHEGVRVHQAPERLFKGSD